MGADERRPGSGQGPVLRIRRNREEFWVRERAAHALSLGCPTAGALGHGAAESRTLSGLATASESAVAAFSRACLRTYPVATFQGLNTRSRCITTFALGLHGIHDSRCHGHALLRLHRPPTRRRDYPARGYKSGEGTSMMQHSAVCAVCGLPGRSPALRARASAPPTLPRTAWINASTPMAPNTEQRFRRDPPGGTAVVRCPNFPL